MREENEYILSTQDQELFRLGVQHQIWASEAQKAWQSAGVKQGDTVLDLGCGPGFCSEEIAFLVGENGKLISVDQSKKYLDFLAQTAKQRNLPIETLHTDFNDLELEPNSIDLMYCRWAMAWIPNAQEILQKIYNVLKPGGKMVIQEYYAWQVHQTFPEYAPLNHAIQQAFKSFTQGKGNINIGREIPCILADLGMQNIQTRPLQKIVQPQHADWQWPKTFYKVYFPLMVEQNLINTAQCEAALVALEELEKQPGATLCCPMMIEIIAQK